MLFSAAASFAQVGWISLPFWLIITIDWLWAVTPTADSRLCRLISHLCCSQKSWYLQEWKVTQTLHSFSIFFCLQRGKQSQQSQPDQSAALGEGTAVCISACSHTAEISSWRWCHKCDVYGLQVLLILSAFGNWFWFYPRIWEIFLRHKGILGPGLNGTRVTHSPPTFSCPSCHSRASNGETKPESFS